MSSGPMLGSFARIVAAHESSFVTCWSVSSESRYSRLSPTCPTAMRDPFTRTPTMVVPIPPYASVLSAARNTRRFARWIAVRRRLPSKDRSLSRPYGHEKSVSPSERRMNADSASIARRDATSPALCPPMPSATANRCASTSEMYMSSFVLRTRPVSDTPHARITLRSSPAEYASKAWFWIRRDYRSADEREQYHLSGICLTGAGPTCRVPGAWCCVLGAGCGVDAVARCGASCYRLPAPAAGLSMDINVVTEGNVTIVQLVGYVDTRASVDFEKKMLELLQGGV